jgi:hypothetical protein
MPQIPPAPAVPASPLMRSNVLVLENTDPENPMLKQIRVYQTTYTSTTDPVRVQADAYHMAMPEDEMPAHPVPFFSVIPRYGEMDAAQYNWYMNWRERVRAGEYPPADSAYVSLYAYELINLTPDPVSPLEALEGIVALWEHYREKEKRLDIRIVAAGVLLRITSSASSHTGIS